MFPEMFSLELLKSIRKGMDITIIFLTLHWIPSFPIDKLTGVLTIGMPEFWSVSFKRGVGEGTSLIETRGCRALVQRILLVHSIHLLYWTLGLAFHCLIDYLSLETSTMDTPVSFAPLNIACDMGAAPFHWGSRDGWILMAPLKKNTMAPRLCL